LVPARISRQHGGALLIIVGIVLILAMTALIRYTPSEMARKLRKQTEISKSLAKIDTALANFVAKNRRLPCPANGLLATGVANAGIEMNFPACNTQTNGVVPWITLGISEDDARDPWSARFTYRVDPALAAAAPLLMNMSNCDVSGTGSVAAGGACRSPTPTCVANPATCTSPATFLIGKGLDVWDGTSAWAARSNNRPAGTGAAYVLISHGETGAGAYNRGGVFQPGTIGPIPLIPGPGTQVAGNDELANLNNQGVFLTSAIGSAYRDSTVDTSRALSHFDDYLSHPTLQTVLGKISLGARVH
jgi:hypothetical protein